MRSAASFTLHAILAACLVAFAASSAAAQSPPTLRIETETPSAAKGDKPRIAVLELQAFKWGTREDSAALGSWAKADGLAVSWDVGEARHVNKVEAITVKQKATEDTAGYAPGNTKYSDVKMTRGSSAAPVGGVTVASGDVTGDSGSASGLPTGKRQHKPFVLTKPVDKGSVWVRVVSPWTACRVGTQYPSLTLSHGSRTYRLEGASVANCGRSTAQADRATEEVAFYYSKISF